MIIGDRGVSDETSRGRPACGGPGGRCDRSAGPVRKPSVNFARAKSACANFAFFNEIEGKTPPDSCEKGGPAPAKTKAELLKYLRDSFDYGNKVLATINEKNAMDRVEGRYGGPNTKLGIAVIAVWHVADHYGQAVYYLRLNGIVPPPTQQHGLPVR